MDKSHLNVYRSCVCYFQQVAEALNYVCSTLINICLCVWNEKIIFPKTTEERVRLLLELQFSK